MNDQRGTAAPVLDIAIPVYNEERILDQRVRALLGYVHAEIPFATPFTIVDNASDDATRLIGKRLAAQFDGIRFMHIAEKGRGRALRAAWMASDAAVLVYMDVDLSTSLNSLGGLIAPLLSGRSDISIGSRLMRGAAVTRNSGVRSSHVPTTFSCMAGAAHAVSRCAVWIQSHTGAGCARVAARGS